MIVNGTKYGNIKDMSGQKFGKLYVIAFHSTVQESPICRRAMWTCLCDCGNTVVIQGKRLRRGGAKSCGCTRRNKVIARMTKHGHCAGNKRHPDYDLWSKMIARCENPNARGFRNYGGRGITVCERWRRSFASFLDDMGSRPSQTYSIDRINNNGNYEPGNCRWATPRQQSQNCRRNVLVNVRGEVLCIAEAARRLGLAQCTLRKRIKLGIPVDAPRKTHKKRDAIALGAVR